MPDGNITGYMFFLFLSGREHIGELNGWTRGSERKQSVPLSLITVNTEGILTAVK